jgi:glycosyltransferase involved in cell wall biosynthesis
MPEISVIVPVFNVEKYILKCVDSILSQSFKDFELLLINDGSTDNSGIICDEYAKKDIRIKVFHKENGGVSSARNLGIEKSLGKWITFVDADDFIEQNSFEFFITNYANTDSDFIIARSFLNANGRLEERYPFQFENSSNFFDGINLAIDKGYLRGSICGVFFRRIFLTQNNLFFPLLLKNGEDSIFSVICFIHAKKIGFAYLHFYNINEREGSASRSWNFERVLFMVNNIRYLNQYMNMHKNISCEAKHILNFSIYSVVSNIYNHFYNCFSLKRYFYLTKEVKNELNHKINIGKIKSCKNKVLILNASIYLFAFIVLFKAYMTNKFKY